MFHSLTIFGSLEVMQELRMARLAQLWQHAPDLKQLWESHTVYRENDGLECEIHRNQGSDSDKLYNSRITSQKHIRDRYQEHTDYSFTWRSSVANFKLYLG